MRSLHNNIQRKKLGKDSENRRALIPRKLHLKLQKLGPGDVNRLLRRGRYLAQFSDTVNIIYGPEQRNVFQYPILVFYAPSDSVNNSYQWKSPFLGPFTYL